MALEEELVRRLDGLTRALTALNTNMFGTTGIRADALSSGSGLLPGGRRPGQGIHSMGDQHQDTLKQIASNTLLQKTLQSNTDTMKFLIKDQKKSITDLGKYSIVTGKFFEHAIRNFSAKQLDTDLPRKLNKIGLPIIQIIGGRLNDYSDVVKLLTRIDYKNVETARALYRSYIEGRKTVEEVTPAIERLGMSFDELSEDFRDGGKKFDARIRQANIALAEFAVTSELASVRGAKLTRAFEVLGLLAVGAGKLMYKTAAAAMKYGVDVNMAMVEQAVRAGMTTTELAEAENQHIQAIYSSEIGLGGFNSMLDTAASSLFVYTGSLKAGAKMVGDIFDSYRTLSSSVAGTTPFITEQEKMFKQLNRTVGVTSDQFSELTKSILSNSDVQAQMYQVSAHQRILALEGIQMQYKKLRLDGLSDEATKKLIDTLNKLEGAPAKERVVEAAKIQGVMGALGMGRMGIEAARIIRMGPYASAADRKRLAEIEVEAQRRVSHRMAGMGGNLGGQIAMQQMTGIIGQFLGPTSPGAIAAYSQGKQQNAKQIAAEEKSRAIGHSKLDKGILASMKIVDAIKSGDSEIVKAIEDLGVMLVAGKLGSLLAGKLGGTAGSLLTKLFPGEIGTTLGGLGATEIGTGLTGLLGGLAGGAAIGGGAGYLFDRLFPHNWLAKLGRHSRGIQAIVGHAAGWVGLAPSMHHALHNTVNIRSLRRKQISDDIQTIAALQHEEGIHPSQKLIDHIAALRDEIAKLQDLQRNQIHATKKVTSTVKEGNDQNGVQNAEHIRNLRMMRHEIVKNKTDIVRTGV